MDVFYEESSIAQNAKKEVKKYRMMVIFAVIAGVLGGLMALLLLFTPIEDGKPNIPWLILWGGQALAFFALAFLFYRWRTRFNVSYDYSFVSGELRIARVINVNKRKLVTRFDVADMIQIGDVDSPSFDRFKSDPSTKTVYCTSNYEASEGKFFMYILTPDNGKKLYVLECREELLLQIMKFAKRTSLDRDYVAQAKKQQA